MSDIKQIYMNSTEEYKRITSSYRSQTLLKWRRLIGFTVKSTIGIGIIHGIWFDSNHEIRFDILRKGDVRTINVNDVNIIEIYGLE